MPHGEDGRHCHFCGAHETEAEDFVEGCEIYVSLDFHLLGQGAMFRSKYRVERLSHEKALLVFSSQSSSTKARDFSLIAATTRALRKSFRNSWTNPPPAKKTVRRSTTSKAAHLHQRSALGAPPQQTGRPLGPQVAGGHPPGAGTFPRASHRPSEQCRSYR